MKDKNGKELRFGDVVRFVNDVDSYEFTIEENDSDGWLWGSDLPVDEVGNGCGENNFHSNDYCEYVTSGKPWGSSKIEFKFI